MEKIKIPKGYQLCARYHQEENGPLTHVVLSKMVNSEIKYFLFDVVNNEAGKQISTSKTPQKFDKIVWPNHTLDQL